MKKRKYYVKLFTVNFLIIIIYILISVFIFFYKDSQIIHMNTGNQTRIVIEQVRDKIDAQIRIGLSILNQIRVNENTVKYVRNDDKDYYNILKLSNELGNHLDAFSGIQFSIGMVKPNDNLVITSRRTVDIDLFLEEKGFTKTQADTIQGYINSKQRLGDYLVTSSTNKPEDGSDRYITLIKKEIVNSYKEVAFFVMFYEKDFLPNLGSEGAESFAIMRGNTKVSIRTSLQSKEIDSILDRHILESIRENRMKSSPYTKIESSFYDVHAIKSAALDWDYLYIVPKSIIQSEFRSLIINSLSIFAVLGLVGILLAFITTRNMYKPIRKILGIFMSFGEIGEEDEFTYFEKTASTIKDANEKLRETLRNSRVSLRDKFLRDLLYGLVPKDNVQEQVEQFGLGHLFGDQVLVVILEYINNSELEENFTKEAVLSIKEQVLLIIKEYIINKMCCEIFMLDYRRVAIIANEFDSEKVRKILNNALSNIEENFEINLAASIGKSGNTDYRISEAFYEALSILEYRVELDKRAVVTIKDVEGINNESFYYPMDFENNLISCVVQGKTEEASLILSRLLEENFEKRKLGLDVINQFVFALTVTIKRILQKVNTPGEELIKEDTMLYNEFKMCKGKKELKQKIIDSFSEIIDKIRSENEKMNNTIADDMVLYIKNNYHKDMNLNDIAEHFNMSQGYICRLFKSQIGGNFLEYLHMYRVEKAKEILKEKNVKIKDVAEMVGCNNIGTFIRIFKKYEGISPGQYIENIRGKQP